MCGIAGFFDRNRRSASHDRGLLQAMTDCLAHRGPDGEGIFHEHGVGLGHRRLAIRDPSQAGAQPMLDTSSRLVITYNGELYNDVELRGELEDLGLAFASRGDTEVILNGFRVWGVDLLPRLHGIFAFALYDRRARSLWLARDPIGVKPLFFHDDGASVLFASELKALLLDPALERRIDDQALDSFFCFNYTPAPHTGVAGVRQLEPGTWLRFTAEGRSGGRFWHLELDPELARLEQREAIEAFDRDLKAAVRRQTAADVPVGAFLSGGLDSAAIAVALANGQCPVQSLYHGRFRHTAYDESPAARQIANHLEMPLVELDVETDVAELPVVISRHLEEPTADASALAVYLLSRATAREVKVVQSGDGADELLAGYATYRANRLASWLGHRALLTPLRRAARWLPVRDERYSWREKVTRFAAYAGEPFARRHASWRRIFSPELRRRIYHPGFLERCSGNDPVAAFAAALEDAPPLPDRLAQALWMDLSFYLPGDMLVKVDRMSMAHGLEVRVPFLDLELVPRLMSLPSHLKLHGREGKVLLRRWLRPALPASILNRPKAGFNVPIEVMLRGAWGDLLLDAVDAVRDELERFLVPVCIESLLAEHRARRADHRYELFGVLMFALWLHNLRHAWPAHSPARMATAAS